MSPTRKSSFLKNWRISFKYLFLVMLAVLIFRVLGMISHEGIEFIEFGNVMLGLSIAFFGSALVSCFIAWYGTRAVE